MAEVNQHIYPVFGLTTLGFWTAVDVWINAGRPEPGLLWPLFIMLITMGLPILYLLLFTEEGA